MSDIAIKVENLGKLYRLGEVGTGTLSHDLNRWWARMQGKEDPYATIGETNDRTAKGNSDYVWSLKDVNFELKQGEVLGIIGRNGAGKSTLLKLLSKVTSPTKGKIKIKGRIASLLEVGTGFHPELTGRENIFLNGAILGMTKAEIRSKFDEIVDFAGVERYIDTPVKRYSSGMYVRLAFAVAAFLEPEILIIDEVLAVGDAEFQKKCLGRMKDVSVNDGRTVLFVSHVMASIAELCTKGLLLSNGTVSAFGEIENILNMYLTKGNSARFENPKKNFSTPEITYAIVSEDELKKGNLHIEFAYRSPFQLHPPIIGFVLYNSLGQPVFASNARMHPKGYNFNVTSSNGIINLKMDKVPLITGLYTLSCFIGDNFQDYNSYMDVIEIYFYSNDIENSKVPDVKNIGSINLTNTQWVHQK
jgi:lipopolysaccharide transport system ATP-binding protein